MTLNNGVLSQANTDIIQLAKGKRGYLRDTGSSAQAQPRGLQRVSRHRSVDTGKANHSDPYTRPPQGGCIIFVAGQGLARPWLPPYSQSPCEASCRINLESDTLLCDA